LIRNRITRDNTGMELVMRGEIRVGKKNKMGDGKAEV